MVKVTMAVMVASMIAGSMAACSSSSNDNGPGGGTGPCGSSGPGGQTNQACDSCTQSKCSSQFNACFGNGGACQGWINGGCKGTPDSTCLNCTETMGGCQQSNCASDCHLGTGADSGAPDYGGLPETGTPTTPNCVALESCCNDPSLPAGAKTGCLYVAGANDVATCKSQLDSLQSAGYCK
jgi:hypothetical protein